MQEVYRSEYRQQWYFETTSRGTYVIRPRSGETKKTDWCMGAGFDLFGRTDGLLVEQIVHKDDKDYRDEWMISQSTGIVTLEAQIESNLCWAACARMASSKYINSQISQGAAAYHQWKNDITLNPSQEQIQSVNVPVVANAVKNTLNYILGSGDSFYADYQIYSAETLSAMQYTNPVIALRGKYENGKRKIGHYVVIVSTRYSSIYNSYICRVYDPAPVNGGKAYECSYDWLCNDKNRLTEFDPPGDGYVWESVIVPLKNYSTENTIPWKGI